MYTKKGFRSELEEAYSVVTQQTDMKKTGRVPGAAEKATVNGSAQSADANMHMAQAGSDREGGPPEKKTRKLGGPKKSDAAEPTALGSFARKMHAKSDPTSPKPKSRGGGKKALPPVGSTEHTAALAKKEAQKKLAATMKEAADAQQTLRTMQSSIASLQDSIDNQKEFKYIEKSADYLEYKEARIAYEEIRKTDEFFNSFITQEIADQKKKIGAETLADIVDRGRLAKFMSAAYVVSGKISVIMSMHEARRLELEKRGEKRGSETSGSGKNLRRRRRTTNR